MSKPKHYIMEMDWKGKEDKFIEVLPQDVMVIEYMKNNNFRKVKNSTVLFERENVVRYAIYGGINSPVDAKPKLDDYYNTFKL